MVFDDCMNKIILFHHNNATYIYMNMSSHRLTNHVKTVLIDAGKVIIIAFDLSTTAVTSC